MEMITLKINGKEYSVPQNSTVLEAARYAGIQIPTLCYLKEIVCWSFLCLLYTSVKHSVSFHLSFNQRCLN